MIAIEAAPGETLSLATMLVQSNDLFVGVADLPLFDADGAPILGDRSDRLAVYDAGTEADQAPGTGPDQAPRQAGADVGASEGGAVHLDDGPYPIPEASSLLRLTVEGG